MGVWRCLKRLGKLVYRGIGDRHPYQSRVFPYHGFMPKGHKAGLGGDSRASDDFSGCRDPATSRVGVAHRHGISICMVNGMLLLFVRNVEKYLQDNEIEGLQGRRTLDEVRTVAASQITLIGCKASKPRYLYLIGASDGMEISADSCAVMRMKDVLAR